MTKLLPCPFCGEKRRQKAMREALEKIATMPLSKDFDLDERGEIKHGSHSYAPAWAAYYFQDLAKRAVSF